MVAAFSSGFGRRPSAPTTKRCAKLLYASAVLSRYLAIFLVNFEIYRNTRPPMQAKDFFLGLLQSVASPQPYMMDLSTMDLSIIFVYHPESNY